MARTIHFSGILLPLVLISSVTTAMSDQLVGKQRNDLMAAGIWVSEHAEI